MPLFRVSISYLQLFQNRIPSVKLWKKVFKKIFVKTKRINWRKLIEKIKSIEFHWETKKRERLTYCWIENRKIKVPLNFYLFRRIIFPVFLVQARHLWIFDSVLVSLFLLLSFENLSILSIFFQNHSGSRSINS